MDELGERTPKTLKSEAEQFWLRAFRKGDASAFQHLVRPHLAALVTLARRHTGDPHWADDLVQETLVRAFRGLPGFRGDASIKTWLFRILVRLASDPARWRWRERAGDLAGIDVPDHFVELPEHGAVERELWQRLAEAMERLTARQRTALHLRAVEGLEYAAIASVLECSQAAVRMLVLEARRKVMARLGEHLEP
jgi:RNA polymerase sigma-70 factor (ECF subfamily)